MSICHKLKFFNSYIVVTWFNSNLVHSIYNRTHSLKYLRLFVAKLWLENQSLETISIRGGELAEPPISQLEYTSTLFLAGMYRVTHKGWDWKDYLKLCKYDDPKVKLSRLPWIQYFNILFYDLAKKEISLLGNRQEKFPPPIISRLNLIQ